jgi:uncharacterized RDD family membrane protein YckC
MNQPEPELTMNTEIPARVKPFAGFLHRTGAFMVDVLVLYFGSRALVSTARENFLAFNPYLPWIAHLVAFLYFALSAGPVGKGRTLGKSIMGLHVIQQDGRILEWKAAFRRSALQQLCFFSFMILSRGNYNSIFLPDYYYAGMLFLTILSLGAFGTLIIQVLSQGIHPHKQCLHDMISGSYVTRDPTPSTYADAFLDQDILTQRKLANHGKIIYLMWPILSAVVILPPLLEFFKPVYREHSTTIAEFQSNYPLDGYDYDYFRFPDPKARVETMEQVMNYHEYLSEQKKADIPSTTSLMLQLPYDGHSISVGAIRRAGPFSLNELENPHFIDSVNILRERLWIRWQEEKAMSAEGNEPPDAPARSFRMIILEPCHFLFYDDARVCAWISGPADPDAGKLSFEEFKGPVFDQQTRDDQDKAPGTGGRSDTTAGAHEDQPTTP